MKPIKLFFFLLFLNINLSYGQISDLITYEKIGEPVLTVFMISRNPNINTLEEFETRHLSGGDIENKITHLEFDSLGKIKLNKTYNYMLGFNESNKYYYNNDKLVRIDKYKNDIKYGSSFMTQNEERPYITRETRIIELQEKDISIFKFNKTDYYTEIYENDSLTCYIVKKSNDILFKNKIKPKNVDCFLIDNNSNNLLEVHSGEIITSFYFSNNILVMEIIHNNENEILEIKKYDFKNQKIIRIETTNYNDDLNEKKEYFYDKGIISSCIKYVYKENDWVEAARYHYKLTFY